MACIDTSDQLQLGEKREDPGNESAVTVLNTRSSLSILITSERLYFSKRKSILLKCYEKRVDQGNVRIADHSNVILGSDGLLQTVVLTKAQYVNSGDKTMSQRAWGINFPFAQDIEIA